VRPGQTLRVEEAHSLLNRKQALSDSKRGLDSVEDTVGKLKPRSVRMEPGGGQGFGDSSARGPVPVEPAGPAESTCAGE
jgi:hypothetical protein